MAEKRGGFRPTAPQNNPANVSATGGAGQSGGGQPARYISGLPYGQGQETMEQQTSATMASTPSPTAPSGDMASGLGMQLRGLFDETQRPNEYISDGVEGTRGAGASALPPSLASDQRPIENTALVQKYLPALMNAGRSVDAPDSYKKFLSYLMDQM
jgi:hypothetical protein